MIAGKKRSFTLLFFLKEILLISSRNPLISDSEVIIAEHSTQLGAESETYISALLASGFRQKWRNSSHAAVVSCPLGTFIDPSAKGKKGCQICPPGIMQDV